MMNTWIGRWLVWCLVGCLCESIYEPIVATSRVDPESSKGSPTRCFINEKRSDYDSRGPCLRRRRQRGQSWCWSRVELYEILNIVVAVSRRELASYTRARLVIFIIEKILTTLLVFSFDIGMFLYNRPGRALVTPRIVRSIDIFIVCRCGRGLIYGSTEFKNLRNINTV